MRGTQITPEAWAAALRRGETRIGVIGATGGDPVTAENKAYKQRLDNLDKQRAREDADRFTRNERIRLDLKTDLDNAQALYNFRLGLEQTLGIDKETLQNAALAREIATLQAGLAATIAEVGAALATTFDELGAKFGVLQTQADTVLDGMVADAQEIERALLSGLSGGSSSGGGGGSATGDYLFAPEQIPGRGDVAGGAGVRVLQTFQHGGTVLGTGPMLAIVHGGERITPAGGGGNSYVFNGPVYGDAGFFKRVDRGIREGKILSRPKGR